MPETKWDELESLVSLLMKDRRRLATENQTLHAQIHQLKERLADLSGESEDLQSRLQTMSELESRQKHLEDEREALKTRVASVLQELENTDFL